MRKGNVTVDDDNMLRLYSCLRRSSPAREKMTDETFVLLVGCRQQEVLYARPVTMNVDPHTVLPRSLPARVSPRGPYAACTVLYHNGRDWKHVERIFGEMVTESDTALRTSIPVLDMLTDFMENPAE